VFISRNSLEVQKGGKEFVRSVNSKGMFSLWLLLVVAGGIVEAISPLTIKGTKFFDSTGKQVFFKGEFRARSGWG
jgi:hypothetical protein